MSKDLKITISGIRGIVGTTFTLDRLIGWVLAWEKTIPEGPIIVGRDARPHGTALQDLTSSALQYVGRQVYLAGLVPTPTVGVLVREFEAAGGIMLTASHNPVEWNALKIFNNNGLLLTPSEFEELRPVWENLPPLSGCEYKPGGETSTINHSLDAHIGQVYRQIDSALIEERHFKVVVDGCKSVGGLALPEGLRKAGVRVVEVDCWPDGAFTRGLEPAPENLGNLCRLVVEEKADLGMAVDPDADRLALVSEKGEPIGEELTLVLAAESVLQRGGDWCRIQSLHHDVAGPDGGEIRLSCLSLQSRRIPCRGHDPGEGCRGWRGGERRCHSAKCAIGPRCPFRSLAGFGSTGPREADPLGEGGHLSSRCDGKGKSPSQ